MAERPKWQTIAAVATGAVLAACSWASAQPGPGGAETVTRPSQDRTLAFTRPMRIARVLVEEGQQVEANQLLLSGDDAAEQAQLAKLKAEAEDDTRIEAAEARLDVNRVQLEAVKEAFSRGATTELELQKARLEVRIGELSLKLTKFQHSQAQREYEEARLQIQAMHLRSPIAGRVERVELGEGEAANALDPVVRVVRIDPLEADVPAPQAVAAGLKTGGRAWVRFDDGSAPVQGRITWIAAVADAASGTRIVRVEVPNPAGRPAGQMVHVRFDAKPGSAGARSARPRPAAADESETKPQ